MAKATAVGALLGLAFERELVEALAVRISVQLGSVAFTEGEVVVVDSTTNEEVTEEGTSLSFGLTVATALQLRLYF